MRGGALCQFLQHSVDRRLRHRRQKRNRARANAHERPGRTRLTDDFRILRIDATTYADESFKVLDSSGLLVLGQLPNWTELRWHAELARRCGADLKWRKVRNRWADLGADLRRAVLLDLRDALISIVDPSLYRLDLEQAIASAVRVPKKSWPERFQAFVKSQLVEYERRSILEDSPAALIQDYLEDDGEILAGTGGIDGNTDETRSIISELDAKLTSAESIRFFGARSAAAFSHLIDRADWRSVIAEAATERRFLTREYVTGLVLARGERTLSIFDEGNQPSVSAFVELKGSIRNRLVSAGRLVVPHGTSTGAAERSSTDTPILQAADLAGGYARDLYLNHGLRIVCEEFKGVIFNGSMVRDWTQVARTNLTELRKSHR